MIEAFSLIKQFPRATGLMRLGRQPPITAVDGVDLSVEEGELFGLIGPNGAGKTTLVKLLCTLILPTSGSARIAGHDLSQDRAIKAAVGLVVTDERSFYWRLSGRRNLLFFAALYGLTGPEATRRVDTVLELVDMLGPADERFSTYSTGMRQRLAIARALLHRPRILFLDEPTRSLDPGATRRLHNLVRALVAEQGVTVFLTTHDLTEAETLCSRVAVMHRGRIRVSAPPDQLRRTLRPGEDYTLVLDRVPASQHELTRLVEGLRIEPEGDGRVQLRFHTNGTTGSLNDALDLLRSERCTIYNVNSTVPSLEEVFAHYTEEA
jgi:ABC-2 type transport system ATP-binding protein